MGTFSANQLARDLQGITDNLGPYDPIYVTMDYACQYIRATYTSNIATATYDPASQRVTATLSGVTDTPTKFYLFIDDEASVMVDVPVFQRNCHRRLHPPGADGGRRHFWRSESPIGA